MARSYSVLPNTPRACLDFVIQLHFLVLYNSNFNEVNVEKLSVIREYIDSCLSEDLKKKAPYGLEIEGKGPVCCLVTSTTLDMQTIEMTIRHQADLLLVNYGSLHNHEMDGITRNCYECVKTLLKYEIDLLIYPVPLIINDSIDISKYNHPSDMPSTSIQTLGRHLKEKFGIMRHYHFDSHNYKNALVEPPASIEELHVLNA